MAKTKRLKNVTKKLRPLGLVKDERVHFQHVESDSHCSVVDLETAVIQDTCHFLSCWSSGDFQIFNQMFNIRETLRQVAVANVVASVNRELTNTMQLVNNFPTSGSRGVNSESVVAENEINEVNFTEHRNRANGNMSNTFRENTIASQVPPAPPNTASAPASSKTLMSDRSPQISTSRQEMHGHLENCLHSISINSKENPMNTVYVQTRNKVDELKSTSSVSFTETVDKCQKGERSPFILTSDVRVKTKNASLSSYALCGTALNHPATKEASRNVDMMSVRSSLDSKSRYGSVNSDDASKVSSEDITTKGAPYVNNVAERNSKSFKNQYEIANCSAVDIDDSMASYVLYGLSPVSTLNKSLTVVGSLGKQKISPNQTVNRLPSIANNESFPSYNKAQIEPLGTANDDRKLTSFDFSEGLKIVSLNHFNSNSSSETVPRGMHYPKTNNTLANNVVTDSDKENLSPDGVVGTNILGPKVTQCIDGLHLIHAPSQFTKNILAGRKRLRRLNRSKSVSSRDKFVSPSPTEYEDNKRPDVIEDFSLVGQSLPNLKTTPTWSVPADVYEQKKQPPGIKFGVDESSQTNWYEIEPSSTSTKQTGFLSSTSTSLDGAVKFSEEKFDLKQNLFRRKVAPESDRDINKTVNSVSYGHEKFKSAFMEKWTKENLISSSLENLKTLGKINSSNDTTSNESGNLKNGHWNSDKMLLKSSSFYNRRFLSPTRKPTSLNETTNSSTINNSGSFTMFKPDGKWQSPWTKPSSENLSTTLKPESEHFTVRSLLDQVMIMSSDSDQDPVGKVVKEPLYMGCSSQVPDSEAKSKFHYIHGANTEHSKSSKVKVLTALDHDVYMDYQHKKYRDNMNTGNLNTALDKPRMHFIKVRVKDDIVL